MVIAWHRPTKAIVHKQAITENVANEIARLNGERIVCCCQSR